MVAFTWDRVLLTALAMFLAWSSASALQAAQVTVGRAMASDAQVSIDQIDHRLWDALLRHYVDENGDVAYAKWKKSRPGQSTLDKYLVQLSHADPDARATRAARLAFWINAYNAVTIKGILREFPTTSIRNHTPIAFGYNIWDDLLLQVCDDQYSLNEMEHGILRKMSEPRIHFAVVCAAKGCPRLRNEAYSPDRLDSQLQDNARDFFSRRQNFRYDQRNQRFYLSAILKWYGEDFGSHRTQQLKSLAPYLPTQAARQAASRGAGRISFLDYDWRLNSQNPVDAQ